MTDDDGSLIDFVQSVSGETFLKVEENLGDGFVRLRISEAERRQAKHDIRSVEDWSSSCFATRATPTRAGSSWRRDEKGTCARSSSSTTA